LVEHSLGKGEVTSSILVIGSISEVRYELTASFEKTAIPIEKPEEFGALKAAVEFAFRPENTRKFLMRLAGKSVRIREFDGVLEHRCLEHVNPPLYQAGKSARDLYQALPVSDQGQIRELYLSKLEQVDPQTRFKFKKLYQYY
jgi:hypothetical protein